MHLFVRIDINIFALILCSLLLYDAYIRAEKQLLEYRLFIAVVVSNSVLLLLESIRWALDGHPGSILAFIYSALNVLHFVFVPAPAFFWALYAHFQVFNDQARTRKILIPLLIPLLANTVLSLLNPVTHSMFYLDSQNFFHRGPLFPLLVAIGFFYLLYALALIISNKHRIRKEYFFPLIGFPVPPVIGSIIQILFYGAFTTHSSITLSLIIVYSNIQAKKLNTDYLTGLYNRMGFQQYLKNKIQSQKEEPFAGIIIDIDNFKRINDLYGHTVGDKVLQTAAALLRKSLRKEDFIARFGGDEFIVIVNARDMSQLEGIVKRIKDNVEEYNLTNSEPFNLAFSMGYDMFDESSMDEHSFLKHIDSLMYKHKRAKIAAQRKKLFGGEFFKKDKGS